MPNLCDVLATGVVGP